MDKEKKEEEKKRRDTSVMLVPKRWTVRKTKEFVFVVMAAGALIGLELESEARWAFGAQLPRRPATNSPVNPRCGARRGHAEG